MTFSIRPAQSDDLTALLDLYLDLHQTDAPLPKDKAMGVFQAILEAPHLELFLLEEAGQLMSSCYLNILPNLTRGAQPYGVIENVVTHHLARRRGFGKAILTHALNAAWQAGCYKVMLMTGRPEMIPFYQACGFVSGSKQALIARAPD